MKYLLATVALLFAVFYTPLHAETVEERIFSGKNLKNLALEYKSGAIRISVSPDQSVHATFQKVNFGKNCRLVTREKGQKLSIKVKHLILGRKNACEMNISLQVPQNMPLNLKGGAGNVTIQETQGDLDLKLGSGTVNIQAEAENVTTNLGAGKIEARGTFEHAKFNTGSG
ncbi:MAG: hypothetical protein GY915_08565, partial [bacterium]|nr:hypothetical protein [bacterium]